MKTPKFHTDFAVVDVKQGRRALARHFDARPSLGPCPADLRIPIVLRGISPVRTAGTTAFRSNSRWRSMPSR